MPIASSRIGKLACRVNLRPEDILIAYRAYIDSSGNKDGDFLTVALVAGSDEMWNSFEGGWESILNNHNPKAAYLHMREIFKQYSKEFNFRKGWSRAKVYDLIWKCLTYLSKVDKSAIRMFHCVIDLNARRQLLSEGYPISEVGQICSDFGVKNVLKWYVSNTKKENFSLSAQRSQDGNRESDSFQFFFDRQEEGAKFFNDDWNQGWDEYERTRKFNPWIMIDAFTPVATKTVPGIQAADLRAWSVNRCKTAAKGMPGYALSEVMEKTIPCSYLEMGELELKRAYPKICGAK